MAVLGPDQHRLANQRQCDDHTDELHVDRLGQEDADHGDQGRQQVADGPRNVAAERGHLDAARLGDRLHHKVRAVADVGHGATGDRAQRDRDQPGLGDAGDQPHAFGPETLVTERAGHLEEGGVGGGVVKEGRQGARESEEGDRVERQLVGDLAEVFQRRDHRQEDADEDDRDLADRAPRELVELESDLLAAGEVRACGGCQEDYFAPGDVVVPGGMAGFDGV